MPELRNLEVEFLSLVDRAAVRDPSSPTEPQRFLLWKKESGAPDPIGGSMTAESAAFESALEKAEARINEAIAKMQEKLDEVTKADAPVLDPEPTADVTDVTKDELPPAVREALAKAEKEAETLRKQASDAEELAKAERDLRVSREFVELAKSELPALGDPTVVGPRLKRLSEVLSKDEYDEHLREQRALNAQLVKSELFKQFGRDGDPTPGAGDVDEIRKVAQELRKSDNSLSEYEAMAAALKGNRDAQDRILNAVR
jgi:hypothetical protein